MSDGQKPFTKVTTAMLGIGDQQAVPWPAPWDTGLVIHRPDGDRPGFESLDELLEIIRQLLGSWFEKGRKVTVGTHREVIPLEPKPGDVIQQYAKGDLVIVIRGRMPVSRKTMAERVQAVLADRDPELKWSDQHRFLQKRVKILLNGEDVTRLCQAFNVPTGRVVLYIEDGKKKLVYWLCACGRFRGKPSREFCPECLHRYQGVAATEGRFGKVEVVPV